MSDTETRPDCPVEERLLAFLTREFSNHIQRRITRGVVITHAPEDTYPYQIEVCAAEYPFYNWTGAPRSIQVTYRERCQRKTTRYPIKDGKFNEAKLGDRIRKTLAWMEQAKKNDAESAKRADERTRQAEILEEELQADNHQEWLWHYSLVRKEKDGKVLYTGEVKFYDIPLEALREIIRLSEREKS